MRKMIRGEHAGGLARTSDQGWLILDRLATVELPSEQDGFPIESVFAGTNTEGWRAAEPGEQIIRLVFDRPVHVNRIQLLFEEPDAERTQEFTLSWCSSDGACQEILRQQWNFSPAGSTVEIEDYTVDLQNVLALKLTIQPDIGGKNTIATLARWWVGGNET
jgi:hypothetical protein